MKGNLFLLLLITLVVLSACEKTASQPAKIELEIKTLGSTTTETYVTNQSILEILKTNHEVEGNQFIKCIDNVCANTNYIWVFYINDEKTLYSPDKYHPQQNDKISLRYEEPK